MTLLPLILLLFQCSFGQKDDTSTVARYLPREITYYYRLGNKNIPVKSLQYGKRKDIVMINLHDDETTSVEAAKMNLEGPGGVLIKIDNNNERIISFVLHGRKYQFDPNRMFTRTGIIASLKKLSRYSSLAAQKIAGFANFLLSKIPKENKMLIALHNNDDGDYSVETYTEGGEYAKDAAAVHIDSTQNKDDFFFTTDSTLYSSFVAEGYNAVLQNNKIATDDGSLSIYYGRRKKSYVNVEAEAGKPEEQSKMISFLVLKKEN